MPNMTTSKGDTVTFRLDPSLKAELTEAADRHHQSLGALLRKLARERVMAEHRHTFGAEACRQSLEAAASTHDPHSDESAVMRELDHDMDEFDDEWK